MKLEWEEDASLRFAETRGGWRVVLLLMAGGAVGSALAGSFPLDDWQGWVGLGMAVGVPVLLALWLEDSHWTFDRARRVAVWKRSRLLWETTGEVSFDSVRGVTIQTGTNNEDYPRDPHVYRVALALPGRALPLTQNYGDREKADRVADAVREAIS
jgi:hypothetical protein